MFKIGLTSMKVMNDVGAYDSYPIVKNGEVVAKLQTEEERMPSVDDDKAEIHWATKLLNMQHVELMAQTQELDQLRARKAAVEEIERK